MKHLHVILLILCDIVCTNGNITALSREPIDDTPPPGKYKITLSEHQHTLKPNDYYQLWANVEPQGPVFSMIHWTTNNQQIVSLNPNYDGSFRVLKTGTAIIYARLNSDSTVYDSCIINVIAPSPCVQGSYETQSITFCSNAEKTITGESDLSEWYNTDKFDYSVGFGKTLTLTVTKDSIFDIYQTQRVDSCMIITKKYKVTVIAPPDFDSTLLTTFDTICFDDQDVLPYTDIVWYKIGADTTIVNAGVTFPGNLVPGGNTFYLQRTTGCESPLIKFDFVYRDCSNDFVPKYYISGTVNPYSGAGLPTVDVFLLDAQNNFGKMDSCSTSSGKFVLRVPDDGTYTFMAVPPAGNIHATTYYGNKTSLEKSRSIPVSSYISGIDINLQLSLGLATSTNTDEEISISAIGGKRIQIDGSQTIRGAAYIISNIMGNAVTSGKIAKLPALISENITTGIYFVRLQYKTGKVSSQTVYIAE